MRRVSILVLAVLSMAAVAAPAAAAAPTVEQGSFVGVDEDFSAELTANCGFPVTVLVYAHETVLTFDDGTVRFIDHYNATVTGAGGTLVLNNNVLQVFSSESYRAAGIPFRVSTADGTTLAKEAGLVIFQFAEGTLTVHGVLPDEGFSFCEALLQQAP